MLSKLSHRLLIQSGLTWLLPQEYAWKQIFLTGNEYQLLASEVGFNHISIVVEDKDIEWKNLDVFINAMHGVFHGQFDPAKMDGDALGKLIEDYRWMVMHLESWLRIRPLHKVVCFWSPARMYFKKFPKNIIIIIVVVVPYFLYTEAHYRWLSRTHGVKRSLIIEVHESTSSYTCIYTDKMLLNTSVVLKSI